jgi:hypothetical protein
MNNEGKKHPPRVNIQANERREVMGGLSEEKVEPVVKIGRHFAARVATSNRHRNDGLPTPDRRPLIFGKPDAIPGHLGSRKIGNPSVCEHQILEDITDHSR